MLLVLIMLGILMEKKHALSLKLPSCFIINILLTVYNYVIITKIVFKSILLSNNCFSNVD